MTESRMRDASLTRRARMISTVRGRRLVLLCDAHRRGFGRRGAAALSVGRCWKAGVVICSLVAHEKQDIGVASSA
jgi:hypothetical protein